MTALTTYLITACAMITATAAIASASFLYSVIDTVGENERRSKRNWRYLTGEDTHRDGVIPRIDELEDRRGEP